jgi:hypothetical protein
MGFIRRAGVAALSLVLAMDVAVAVGAAAGFAPSQGGMPHILSAMKYHLIQNGGAVASHHSSLDIYLPRA